MALNFLLLTVRRAEGASESDGVLATCETLSDGKTDEELGVALDWGGVDLSASISVFLIELMMDSQLHMAMSRQQAAPPPRAEVIRALSRPAKRQHCACRTTTHQLETGV